MSACYLDSSAIVKLVADESESAALRQWVRDRSIRLTSRVATVEVQRALRRKGAASVEIGAERVAAMLQALAIVELDAAIADHAVGLDPAALRSMDAVHLASALSVGDELDAFVTYDHRLADAGRAAGLTVVVPA